jgi:hypothetical protein
LAALCTIAAACTEAPAPESAPDTPRNVCASITDCPPQSLCDRDTPACVLCDPDTGGCGASVAPLGVVYVISFPATTSIGVAQGLTVSFARADLARCTVAKSRCATPGACFCVPSFGLHTAPELVRIDPRVARAVGFEPQVDTTLPIAATFRPLTPFDPIDTLASVAEMPMPVIVGKPSIVQGAPGAVPGPRGTPPLGFQVVLPPGRYLRSLEPLPPFDEIFPPVVGVIRSPDSVGAVITNVGTPLEFPLESDEDLDGWQLYVRDLELGGQRITNVFRPHLGSNAVKLFTAGSVDFGRRVVELVIEPPPGRDAVPSLIADAQFIANQKRTMPKLRAPQSIEGVVVGNPEGALVPATLVFQSVVEQDISQLEPVNNNLRYAKEIATDPTGAFSVRLPPGKYDVAVLPARETGFAAVVHSLVVPTGGGPRSGLGFEAVRLRSLQGVVRAPGDRPLAGATVRAVPSEDPAALESTAAPADDAGVAPRVPFRSLARTRTTTTSAPERFCWRSFRASTISS